MPALPPITTTVCPSSSGSRSVGEAVVHFCIFVVPVFVRYGSATNGIDLTSVSRPAQPPGMTSSLRGGLKAQRVVRCPLRFAGPSTIGRGNGDIEGGHR